MERLRQSRSKLQDRFRKLSKDDFKDDSFIEDLMREELEVIQKSLYSSSNDIEIDDIDLKDLDLDIDTTLSLFEDIQEELRREEMKLLEEFDTYERSLHIEEAALCTAIERLSADEVICPVCQKNPLLQNKSVIFCKCGMRVNTEQDCLTLKDIKKQLEDGMSQHGNTCDGFATFSVVEDLGSQNLLMSCKVSFLFVKKQHLLCVAFKN
ncbi:hypothetical protein KUTeg_009491 [Tegillarca granosa]|uniref:RPA-interacting protein C-terminal domain-containing protein n=1 Tax=Tegillarca granosa TaxID=220873 RepID=A0ABQ9F925_TEGGR|nr:hypothetical protein KUTeg_009491 [Tegillarca granosa]